MTKLTITSKGQVTLRKEVLRHLGVAPGDQVEVDLLPDRRIAIQTPKRTGSIEDFFGALGPWEGPPVSLEEIKKAIEEGWASAMDFDKRQKKHDPKG